jgi:hypothetical protein
MKYSRIQTTGNISNRYIEILACVDNKYSNQTEFDKGIYQFKTAAERMCLKICKLREK